MLIDISDLLENRQIHKQVDISFESKNIIFEKEEIIFLEPVSIKGEFLFSGDMVNFHGKMKTRLGLTCYRCLEKFDYPLEIEVDEEFSKLKNDNDDDIIIIDGGKIDFSQVIETNVILSLPMKKLCSEKCKGLCPICGTNLNHSNCNCKESDIDPRLAKLRDFFSNN